MERPLADKRPIGPFAQQDIRGRWVIDIDRRAHGPKGVIETFTAEVMEAEGVDSQRLTIPRYVRKQLDISPGDEVAVDISPISRTGGLSDSSIVSDEHTISFPSKPTDIDVGDEVEVQILEIKS